MIASLLCKYNMPMPYSALLNAASRWREIFKAKRDENGEMMLMKWEMKLMFFVRAGGDKLLKCNTE
jgi:hypothetical protein